MKDEKSVIFRIATSVFAINLQYKSHNFTHEVFLHSIQYDRVQIYILAPYSHLLIHLTLNSVQQWTQRKEKEKNLQIIYCNETTLLAKNILRVTTLSNYIQARVCRNLDIESTYFFSEARNVKKARVLKLSPLW